MPRGRGKRKAADTRRKDSNPRSSKRQKINCGENLFDTLSDEIIQNIFISSDYSKLAKLRSVCHRFNAVAKHQNFWKSLAIITFGSNVAPLKVTNIQGVVEFDCTEYLLPTFSDGNKKHIDWPRYFKLRHAIQNMVSALDKHYEIESREARGLSIDSSDDDALSNDNESEEQNEQQGSDQHSDDEDEGDAENEDNEEEENEQNNEEDHNETSREYPRLEDDEIDAYTKSIIHLLNDVSQEMYIYDRPRRLLRVTVAFIIEILPLFIEYGIHARVKQCAWLMYSYNKGTYFTLAKNEIFIHRAFIVYELVKYQPRLRDKMLKQICELWIHFYRHTRDKEAEVYAMFKRIVSEIMDSFKAVEEYDWDQSDEINFGNEDYEPPQWFNVPLNYPEQSESEEDPEETANIPCDILRFPQRGKTHARKSSLVSCMMDIDDPLGLEDVVVDLIVQYFDETEDLERKAFALELTNMIGRLGDDQVPNLVSMAIDAESTGYDRLVFSAYVILTRIIILDDCASAIDEEDLADVLDILIRGIAARPRSGLHFIWAIVELLKVVDVAEIDDETFDELITNVLFLLSQNRKIFNKHNYRPHAGNLWERFGLLGAKFGARMKKYLSMYEEAFIKLAASKVKRYRPFTNEKKIPFFTKPQILYQYAVLGKKALGAEFEPTLERFVEKVMNGTIGFEVDMPEFQALFGNECFKVMKKDPAQLAQMIDDLLQVISKDIPRYGQSTVMDQHNYYMPLDWYKSQLPNYLPLTIEEYHNAVAIKKPTTKQTEEIFTFEDAKPRGVEYDKEKSMGWGYRGMQKFAVKYTQYHPDIMQFNPTSDSELEYSFNDIVEAINEETNFQAANRLVLIFNYDQELFTTKHTQQTLRVLLGFLRAKSRDLLFYNAAIDLYAKLAPLLSEEDKEKHIEIFSIICLRIPRWAQSNELLPPVLCKIQSMVLDFIECSKDTLTNLMEHSLDFAFIMSPTKYVKNNDLQLVYHLVKRLLKYSPRKTFQAVSQSEVRNILDRYNDEPEYLCTIAVLGYHFGVEFIEKAGETWGKSIKVDLTDIYEHLFKWYKSKRKKSAEQIMEVENFMVLLSACNVNDQLKTLCLYNSVFFDEKMFLSAIKSDKFDTKIKSLNERVKKWTSITDLFDTDSL